MDNALIYIWEKLNREPVQEQDYSISYWETDSLYGERQGYESEFTYYKD